MKKQIQKERSKDLSKFENLRLKNLKVIIGGNDGSIIDTPIIVNGRPR